MGSNNVAIGWTYSEKSSGPRTAPCGTPAVRVVVLDDWPLLAASALADTISSNLVLCQ